MRTSTTVLALLGASILGAQANDQFFELDELFMQDLESEAADDNTEAADPIRQLKNFTAQISNAIEMEGGAFRKLIRDSLKVQQQGNPDVSKGHLQELIDEYAVIVLNLQHSIMDLSATSGKVVTTLHKVNGYFKKAQDEKVKEATRVKYAQIGLKRLKGIVEDVQEETDKLASSDALKKIGQFKKKVESQKFDEKKLVTLENQLAKANEQMSEAREKEDKSKKEIKFITKWINQEREVQDKTLVNKTCSGFGAGTVKCAQMLGKYIHKDQADLARYQQEQKHHLANLQTAASNQRTASKDQYNLNQTIKSYEKKIEQFHVNKKAFAVVQGELLAVAKEMHDIKSLIQYSNATKEVLNDVANFVAKKEASDTVDVNDDEYKTIQEYGESTSELEGAAYFKEISASFKRADISFDCGRQLVDQMVAKAASQPIKKLDAKCKAK